MILWFFGLCALFGAVLGLVQPSNQTRQTARKQPTQAHTMTEDNGAAIAYYTAKLAQLEDLQRRIEHEYQNAKTNKQAITAHKQMISLDEQIYKTTRKVEALRNE